MEDKNIKGVVMQSQGMPTRLRTRQEKTTEEAQVIQLIVFNLGKQEYGAEIGQLREILRVGSITPIPDSPAFIKGVTNVRGEIVVAIDLKERFFLPIKKEVEEKHIVITEQEKNRFGLMVDEVTEVLRIPETDIKPTPELVTRIDRIYISGVITLQNRLIILLDLAKVLSEGELTKLAEFARRHRADEEKQSKKEEDRERKAEEMKEETPAQPEKPERKSKRGRK